MSAAVSAMQHQPGAGSKPASRMGTSSPVDGKRGANGKAEDSSRQHFPNVSSKLNPASNTSAQANSQTTSQTEPPAADQTDPPAAESENAEGQNEGARDTPSDYFSMPRPSRLDQEPNPFEQSFAGGSSGSADPLATPKAILPPVTAISSPAPLLGGSGGYNWGPHSLRSGPLSPAMLQGPTNASSLGFDHIRSGLTPNESGIRSGLTPGGTGPMFPAPSPSGTQFLFGGSTPGTMEFQKTAISAARKSHPPPPLVATQNQETKPDESQLNAINQMNPAQTSTHHHHKPRQPSDPYNQGPEHNAANGLYLLAQMGGAPNTYPQSSHISTTMAPNGPGGNMEPSPNLAKRAINNAATVSDPARRFSASGPNSIRGMSEMSNDRSGSSQEPEPSSGRKSRNAKAKATAATSGKRKNEEVAGNGKAATNKKAKSTRAMSASDDGMEDYDEDPQNEGIRKDGKKMTDEEKRKNFLERNRVAALKCRQRKKQWLANLQAKVELYGSENDALNATVQSLREEIVSLKTLLLAHKDCPVARTNGVQLEMAAMTGGGDYGHVQMMGGAYPGMMQANVMHQQGAESRRFS